MLTPPQHLRGIGGIMMEGSALAPILRLESESKNVFFANFALAKAKMSLESASLRQQVPAAAAQLDEEICVGRQNFCSRQLLCCLEAGQARRVLRAFCGGGLREETCNSIICVTPPPLLTSDCQP